jgi:hypothetical protein
MSGTRPVDWIYVDDVVEGLLGSLMRRTWKARPSTSGRAIW